MEIKIKPKSTRRIAAELKEQTQSLQKTIRKLDGAAYGLDSISAAGLPELKRKICSLQEDLQTQMSSLKVMYQSLEKITSLYEQTEANVIELGQKTGDKEHWSTGIMDISIDPAILSKLFTA